MDRAEFEREAVVHLDAVYRMSMHLTRNPEQAEDLVQEVYLRALRSVEKNGFESKGAGLRAWLFAIVHNTFYTHVKKLKRAPVAVEDFSYDEGREGQPDEPVNAWDAKTFDWEHVDDRLVRAVESLKDEYREVLLLWGVEGLKYREIAEILELPIGTIMSRLHRARKLAAETLLREDGAADAFRLVGDGAVRDGTAGDGANTG
ncbi:MAG: sigma-70 family RNA polymerase sigma factor [Planctomycetota bacterium]